MRADNSHHLVAAAQRRAASTRARATTAVQALHDAGQPITFESVATKAGVSRAWLYSNDEVRDAINRLREHTRVGGADAAVPARQQASDASLLRRLEVALDRVQRLTAENATLRAQLERALGQARGKQQSGAPDG